MSEIKIKVQPWLLKAHNLVEDTPAPPPAQCAEADHNWVVAFDSVGRHDACTNCSVIQR